MGSYKELIGLEIRPTEEIGITEKTLLLKAISRIICSKIKSLAGFDKALFMRLYNLKIMYADMAQKHGGAYYCAEENILFIDKNIDVENPSAKVFEQILLFSTYNDHEGLTLTNSQKHIIKYYSLKLSGKNVHRETSKYLSYSTNSNEKDRFSLALSNEIDGLIGEQTLINLILFDAQDYVKTVEKAFKGNSSQIENCINRIVEIENQVYFDEEAIVEQYLNAQKLLYTSFFENNLNEVHYSNEIDELVSKLNNFETIVAHKMNESEDEFTTFKKEFESKCFDMYIQVQKIEEKQALMVVKYNPFKMFLMRLISHFKKKESV